MLILKAAKSIKLEKAKNIESYSNVLLLIINCRMILRISGIYLGFLSPRSAECIILHTSEALKNILNNILSFM